MKIPSQQFGSQSNAKSHDIPKEILQYLIFFHLEKFVTIHAHERQYKSIDNFAHNELTLQKQTRKIINDEKVNHKNIYKERNKN